MISDKVNSSHVHAVNGPCMYRLITVYLMQTVCNVNTYIMGRNPDYVEEPLAFKPERWSRDGSTPKLDPSVSNTFGFGPRNCYGTATLM